MTYLESIKRVFTSDRGMRALEMAAATVVLFVAIDAVVVHPFVWENQPTLYYFLAKPLWVGLGLVVAMGALLAYTDASTRTLVAVGGFVGIVYLQLYYTVVPIPMVGGETVQVGLVGNLTEGLLTHAGAFLTAFVVVVLIYKIGGEI